MHPNPMRLSNNNANSLPNRKWKVSWVGTLGRCVPYKSCLAQSRLVGSKLRRGSPPNKAGLSGPFGCGISSKWSGYGVPPFIHVQNWRPSSKWVGGFLSAPINTIPPPTFADFACASLARLLQEALHLLQLVIEDPAQAPHLCHCPAQTL